MNDQMVLNKRNTQFDREISGEYRSLVLFPYCSTRAGISRADQYYASYPAGTELLTDT
jgi:hypothetical protein